MKRTWIFWYETPTTQEEHIVGEYDCIQPERTKMAKQLEKEVREAGSKKYGFKLKDGHGIKGLDLTIPSK